MFDLDHFKRINDTHGHDVGDRALELFASLLRDVLPAGGLAGRLGGEEFVALLKHAADVPAAHELDHRLRGKLAAATGQHLGFSLGYSAGTATVSPHRMPAPVHLRTDLMARADAALYRAKEQGRGHLLEAAVAA